MLTFLSLLIIVICFIFGWWIIKNEATDTRCSSEGVCLEGGSKYFISGKHAAGDTIEDTLKKIEYLNMTPSRMVMWRRAFIVSFLIVILSGLILKLPARDLTVIFLLSFIFINGMISFYRFHLDIYPQGFLQENVDALRFSLKQPRVATPKDNLLETLKSIRGKRFD